MFKINQLKINELINIKYKDIKNKENLEGYNIENENIKLNSNIEINACKFNGVIFDKVNIKFSTIEDVEFVIYLI